MPTITWPNTRDAVFELIDGHEFAGREVHAFYRIPADPGGRLTSVPAVLIYQSGGTQNTSTNRQDRLRVDVYATGTAADEIGQAICSMLTSTYHKTSHGRIDRVYVEATPNDVPYPDPAIDISSAVYRVSVRPR